MRFSINCSTVICSPTVNYAILREATSETYGPRVYFPSYKFPIYFTLQSLLSIYIIKIPKNFILLSLSDLTFASGREGIDNPFIALVARFLFVCVGGTAELCICGKLFANLFLTVFLTVNIPLFYGATYVLKQHGPQ